MQIITINLRIGEASLTFTLAFIYNYALTSEVFYDSNVIIGGEIIIKEKRAHKRSRVNVRVTYASLSARKSYVEKGTTSDISYSGMCFYTDKFLLPGLALNVKVPKIWNVPRTCVVNWNSIERTNRYKVGVSFI